jgi:signal transduction histidine kinase
VARQVGQFAAAGVVALVVVAWATTIASRRVGEREAISDARSTTVARAEGVVTRALSDDILTADPEAVAAVGRAVEQGVLDPSLVRVKVWARDGTILYSDEPRLVGAQYVLGADQARSLDTGAIEAEVSDLSKPENRFERPFGRLLEVYLPVYTPSGEPVLFEAYYRYDAVSDAGTSLWRAFAPITLGALVVLQLVQVPLAWSLARRLRQRVEERERLLQHALDAYDVERRQIAADLHDGVVQDLAGVAYALSAAARSSRAEHATAAPADGARGDEVLESAAETVRSSITALRTLLVDLYPPNLESEGFESALDDLAAGARARGLTVEVDTADLDGALPPPVAQLLYRVAQEGLRNVVRHAGAASAHVRVARGDSSARLEISDDGRGYDPEEARQRAADGHVGLRGLGSLVEDAGGTLAVTTRPGGGTRLDVEVPV